MGEEKLAPFVKWAGGKRQLLPYIKEKAPKKFNNYFEPFLGGGAVLFEFQPENATISDTNLSLINCYKKIKESPKEFIEKVRELEENACEDPKEHYYFLRDCYNEKLIKEEYDIELAALFIYLNKRCYNGLYRVNKKGLFNTPYNYKKDNIINEDLILNISEYLKGVNILGEDFEKACVNAESGDFVFFDSPYAPLDNSTFKAYTKEGFGLEEHRRLSNLFDNLTGKGCFCILTNHNTKLINDLYGDKGYNLEVVSVRRSINSNANNRRGEEIIITNF